MSKGIRFVGKDPDGIAKAISVNDDGVLLVELLGSKVQQEIQTLEPRTDNWIYIDIPHTLDGVFEQMIIIKHTLDATLWVALAAKTPVVGGYLFSNFKLEANQQLILTPESDGFTNDPYDGVTTISKSVVDLRMPYSGFRLAMRPRVSASDSTPKAPTTGDITVATIKRY